jgi:lipopolysaccharide export system permease protein
MPMKLQSYLFVNALRGLALTLTVILFTILLVDVVEQLRTVGRRAAISLDQAALLTALKAPMLMMQALPFAVLIGAMISFTKLSRSSELPAIRAAGVSAWRFLAPSLLLAVLLGVSSAFLLDPLASRANEAFEQERARLTGRPATGVTIPNQGLWLRQGDDQGQIVIHARGASERGEALLNATFYEFERVAAGRGDEFAFARRFDVERAQLRDGFWQLTGVTENEPGLEPKRAQDLAISSSLDPQTLLNRFASPNTVGFWQLPAFIFEAEAAGLDANRYRMKFHSLLATPVLLAAMTLIGAGFCMRLARLGGTSQLVLMGAASGFLLFFLTQLSSGLAAANVAPPAAAAWCPAFAALFAALAWFAYREDG